jgi:lysyl-tRNA synthetase class 1
MTNSQASKFWLDQITDQITQRFPEGEINVASGHSPSGIYHIGTIREVATASAITWALQRRGRRAVHQDFVDDYDILRKIPADLPPSTRSELGKPLFLADSPEVGVSYGDYFYRDLEVSLRQAGFKPDQTFRASVTYHQEHRYTEAITLALSKLEQARRIIETVSQRRLPADWAPVQLLSDDQRLNQWVYTGHDTSRQVVFYRDQAGKDGELSYAQGRVKLDWRLDWPARWWLWQVKVEPFGRDHATKGGSYDTGKQLVRDIFGGEPPVPVPYEFIMTVGDTKKMSKSAGGVITPGEAMEVMPAEVLRYFVVRSQPSKQLSFDSGVGLYNLIDEFAAAEQAIRTQQPHPFKEAAEFALAGRGDSVISSIPFKHLVSVYQAARGDTAQSLQILARTGYANEVKDQEAVITAELRLVQNWLQRYAPEEVKFAVQDKLPPIELTDSQRRFLNALAEAISSNNHELDGQRLHELIYASKDRTDLEPKAAFQAIYRVLLNKDYGPKAGWFLATLDRDWLVRRLRLQD